MAKKTPLNAAETTPVITVSAEDLEALISEKVRAGLTRTQAEHVIAAQAEHDQQLAEATA